jgi:hypothetical protein
MTPEQCANLLRDHNEWRRGGEGEATNPLELGNAIDTAVDLIDQQSDISTLEQESRQMRARMERLESERNAAFAALVNSRNALESANEMGDGPIIDTIWYGPAETLFDYMDSAIAAVQP